MSIILYEINDAVDCKMHLHFMYHQEGQNHAKTNNKIYSNFRDVKMWENVCLRTNEIMAYVEEIVKSEMKSTERSFCLQIQILGLQVFARLMCFFFLCFFLLSIHSQLLVSIKFSRHVQVKCLPSLNGLTSPVITTVLEIPGLHEYLLAFCREGSLGIE